MVVKELSSDGEFAASLENAGGKLVVVDFFATWCGPCKMMAPKFSQLSDRYPTCVFLKVDVDKLTGVSHSQGISSMPTFHFYVSKARVDSVKGADGDQLERKVKQWADSTSAATNADSDGPTPPAGQVDLSAFYAKNQLECLNEDDVHTFKNMVDGISALKSDTDEQLIISIPFNQPVKLHSISVKAPTAGPKTLKLFINQSTTPDFSTAESSIPQQEIELKAEQVESGEIVNLRYVKFQNVQNLVVFVVDNVAGTDVTNLESLRLYGSPLNATDMSQFKRVAGKPGEVHA